MLDYITDWWGDAKGWRTISVNVAIAAGTAALQYLAGVNWVDLVGPTWSVIIITGINLGMRFVTDTKVGAKK